MAESKPRVATDEEMAEDAIATATEATEFTKAVVTVDGRDYELTFTRAQVKRMERDGFNPASIDSTPATSIEALVVGAFEAKHPSMTRQQRLDVWAALGNKEGEDGLLAALVQLYMAPVNSLIADPTEATGTWKLV